MKKLFKRMKVMREGATLVTVVIATAFLIAIGVVILAASTRYLVSVYMDRNTNENMYSAEGYLAEVRTGLLEYAGDASIVTYKDIMEDYEKYKGIAGSTFGKRFVARMVAKLQHQPVTTFAWDDTKVYKDAAPPANPENLRIPLDLKEVRKLTSLGAPDDSDDAAKASHPVVSLREFSDRLVADGAAAITLPAGESGDLYGVIHFSSTRGYYLIIKNLVIDYKDDANYRTAIQTDIQINAPDYKFEGGKTFDEARDYIIISDGALKTGVGGNKFNGNIYTGAGMTDDPNTFGNNGIEINNGDATAGIGNTDYALADEFKSDKIISRGGLKIFHGAKVSISGPDSVADGTVPGEVYLKNIKLCSYPEDNPNSEGGTDGSDWHSEFTLNTNSYIENDLDIRDNNSVVKLGGKYYGYSYNYHNDHNEDSLAQYNSIYSSAILVNGYNSTLESVDLKKLVLSGRAFVERTKDNPPAGEKNDIILGQSIAVKSDQFAYLVPDTYMITEHNPVSAAEAADDSSIEYGDPLKLIKSKYAKDNFELLKQEFSDENGTFLDDTNPVTGNYLNPNYVFVYLNFANQKRANDFFKKYYTDTTGNAKDLKERVKPYISSLNSGFRISSDLYLLAGNIIRNYASNDLLGANYFDDSGIPSQALLQDGINIGRRYMNYVSNLSAGDMSGVGAMRFDEIDDPLNPSNPKNQDPIVTKKMINFAPLSDPGFPAIEDNSRKTSGVATGEEVTVKVKKGAYTDSINGGILLVADGDVTIPSSIDGYGLIIAHGNVKVSSSAKFKGLIISSGEVIAAGGAELNSYRELVEKLFEYMQSDENLCKLFYGGSDPITDNEKDLEKCVRYLDWQKNTY